MAIEEPVCELPFLCCILKEAFCQTFFFKEFLVFQEFVVFFSHPFFRGVVIPVLQYLGVSFVCMNACVQIRYGRKRKPKKVTQNI